MLSGGFLLVNFFAVGTFSHYFDQLEINYTQEYHQNKTRFSGSGKVKPRQ
jgi:hypothetical protein